jgi:hypothetical protein
MATTTTTTPGEYRKCSENNIKIQKTTATFRRITRPLEE